MAVHVDELRTLLTLQGGSRYAGGLRGVVGGMSGFVQRNQRMMDGLALAGPYLSAAGDRLMSFSNQNVALARTAEDVQKELRAMYEVKGYSEEDLGKAVQMAEHIQDVSGASDEASKRAATLMATFAMTPDEILEFMPLVTRQAHVMKRDVESVALAVGKAFGSGMYGELARFGMTLSPAAKKTLLLAQSLARTGDAANVAKARTMAYDIMVQSLADNTITLEDMTRSSEGQIRRFQSTMGDLREEMGDGVAQAQGWAANIGFSLIRPLVGVNKQGKEMMGWISYGGGAALKGMGWLGNFSRDVLSLQATLNLARGAQVGSSAAMAAGIPITTTATGATIAKTGATTAGTAANYAHATSIWAMITPLAVLIAALAAVALWYRNVKVGLEAWNEAQYGREQEKNVKSMEEALKRQKAEIASGERKTFGETGVAPTPVAYTRRDTRGVGHRTAGDQSWWSGNAGMRDAMAVRQPGGDINVRIRGGAGISERDLTNFNTVAQ